jgi:hypothetical protein
MADHHASAAAGWGALGPGLGAEDMGKMGMDLIKFGLF